MVESAISFDLQGAFQALDALGAATKDHLPRSMCVAGGRVMRDEAQARAPVYDGTSSLPFGSNRSDSPWPGQLRDAIYLAYSEDRSIPDQGYAVYSVTWNKAKAPHGYLIEFGHWRYNRIGGGYPQKSLPKGKSKGKGAADHTAPGALDTPKWVPANPFLRPAYDAAVHRVIQSMLDRGHDRVAEIMDEIAAQGRP